MENNVVDVLRDRAEENLDDVLKTSMGGYTKKSVQDYVSQMRKQQQVANKRFNASMRQLLSEKEALAEELKQAKARLSQRDAQYQALNNSIESYKQPGETVGVAEMILLKEQVAKLTEENTAYSSQNTQLESDKQLLALKFAQTQHLLEETKQELEQANQAHLVTREQLAEEQKKLTAALLETQEKGSELTTVQSELNFLKEQNSRGANARLKDKNTELSKSLKDQQDLLAQRKAELAQRDKWLQTTKQELEMAQSQKQVQEEKAAKLQEALNLMTAQNQKLELYQKELAQKLQAVFHDNLAALEEKAALQLEIIRLNEKLEEKKRGIE